MLQKNETSNLAHIQETFKRCGTMPCDLECLLTHVWFQLPPDGVRLCSYSVTHHCFGFKRWVVNQFKTKMPASRSVFATTGGLPDPSPGWLPLSRPGGSRGARNPRNTARNPTVANKEIRARAGAVPEVATKTSAGLGTDIGLGIDELEGVEDTDPHNSNPPHTVWMGLQACDVEDIAAAESLAGNLFLNSFSRCLEVTRKDVKDTFKTLEKRSENEITVEPCTKTVVLAFHHWVKTCHWLGVDPEQTPFPATVLMKSSKRQMNAISLSWTPPTLRQLPNQVCSPKMMNGMTGQSYLKNI